MTKATTDPAAWPSDDMLPADPGPQAVISFWEDAGRHRWFSKDASFDALFGRRFRAAHDAAAARRLDAWATTAAGSLALLILLDQYPRNAFRGTAHMYATDPLARHFARRAVALRHDLAVAPSLRLFFYLPFAHSEDLDDQERSVELHAELGEGEDRHAIGHRDVIRRFGRFPHRNPMLGRETTLEEARFLADGGFAG